MNERMNRIKVLVHGTKGGYRILHDVGGCPRSIARDYRRIDRNEPSSIGQEAYSIALAEGGMAVSKYLVVWDEMRNAVGNIAFSLYVPDGYLMPGTSIKGLLDALTTEYAGKYIVNGNLGSKTEDWSFIDRMLEDYGRSVSAARGGMPSNFQQSEEEAAYMYFTSDTELIRFFDALRQKAYTRFKQVFLVHQRYEGSRSNPLHSLRHDERANIRTEIDLERKVYRFVAGSAGAAGDASLYLEKQGRRVQPGEEIASTDSLTLRTGKNERFYEYARQDFEVKDPNAGLYIQLDPLAETLRIHPDFQFPPRKLEFRVDGPVRQGRALEILPEYLVVEHARSGQRLRRSAQGRSIAFMGEELGEPWYLSYNHGDVQAKSDPFVPEQEQSGIVVLRSFKAVTLNVTLQGQVVKDYQILNDKNQNQYQVKDKPWNLELPLDGGQVSFDLNIIRHGCYNQQVNIKLSDGLDRYTIPLRKMEKAYPPGPIDKSKTPFWREPRILLAAAGVLALVVVAFLFFGTSGDDDASAGTSLQKDLDYVNGTELQEGKLRSIRMKYCNAPSRSAFERFTDLFGGSDTETTDKDKKKICDKIAVAEELRFHIDQGAISAVIDMKGKLSNPQKSALDALWSKDTGNSPLLDTMMKEFKLSTDRTSMGLHDLANFVVQFKEIWSLPSGDSARLALEIDTLCRDFFAGDAGCSTRLQTKKAAAPVVAATPAPTPAPTPAQRPASAAPSPPVANVPAQKESKGQGTPNGNGNGGAAASQSSKEKKLESDFFALVKSGNTTYDSYKKLNNDPAYKDLDTKIKKFLKKITVNSAAFIPFKNIAESDRISIKTIEELEAKYLVE